MEQSIPLFLSRNDSIGSVVLAASSSARASLFTRYGPSIGPRLALASSCERIRHAIPFLPTESFRRGPVSWGMPASWGDRGHDFRSGPFSCAVAGILENFQPS